MTPTRDLRSTRRAAGALLLVAATLAGHAAAQGTYPAGSVVGRSDYDFTPRPAELADASACFVDDDGSGTYTPGEAVTLDTDAAACEPIAPADVRLTAHGDLPAGSLVKGSDRDTGFPTLPLPADDLHAFDADGSGDFNGKDTLYLDIVAPDAFRAGPGDLRLTPFGALAAFTVVRDGDPDAGAGLGEVRGAGFDLADDEILYMTGGGLPFKPGRSLYINVDAGEIGVADLAVEANDVRLTATVPQPFGGTADIRATAITLAPPSPRAGQAFQATVGLQNQGKATGAASIATMLNGAVADQRTTLALDPGGRQNLTLLLVAPAAGPATLEAAGLRVSLDVGAALPSGGAPAEASADTQALQRRIAALEEQLAQTAATQQAQLAASASLREEVRALAAPAAEGPRTQATSTEAVRAAPGPELALLGALAVAVAVAARRPRTP